MMRKLLLSCTLMIAALITVAQTTVSGTIVDSESGEALIGATVIEKGTNNGSITDINGAFSLSVKSGATLTISYIGYETMEVSADSDLSSLSMVSGSIGLAEVMVIASFGIDRQTPVAMANVRADVIEAKIGNQEFPEILKSTPGVFATKSGGGFGDGRINIRGFNSENVAVLINGIPVNDMENGRIFWSNWAGLTDATSAMQVQRGLGASKVAVPSIGGTINIVSKASDRSKGGYGYVATGNDAYSKVGFQISTGLQDNGWAVTLSAAKTQGDGYVDGTEFLGHSYFANIAKRINDSHELTFTAVGAKQRHGQRQNQHSLATFEAAPSGIKYNSDWGIRDGKVVNFEDNFYHKPQTSLNHYWTINDGTELSTAVYASWGTGGGGGTGGNWNVGPNNSRVTTGGPYDPVDVDLLVETNRANASGEALAFQRASRNDHNWYGVLSTLNHELSQNLTLLAGLDVRSYVGKHFYEVTDLLGGEYIINNDDVNQPNKVIGVGDKFNYNYDGVVGWQGAFGQVEYNEGDLSVFGTLSVSNTSYSQIERFNTPGNSADETDKVKFFGFQIKGGANYNLTSNHNIFANVGFFSKAPFYRNVFLSRTSNNINENAENEKILSFEIGYGYRKSNLSLNVNAYMTQWKDRSFVRSLNQNDIQYFANILGVDATHQGLEIDAAYDIYRNLKLTGMLSVQNNLWKNDVENVFIEDEDGNQIGSAINVFSDGLKVGDAAQTTAALGITYEMFDGFSLGADYTYFDNLYASFDPIGRSDVGDRADAWKVPAAGVLDVNMTYNFKISDLESSIFANVYNVGDVEYVADANDGGGHDAASASVYYAFGVNWNVGLKVRF
ncbi:MAG: carboxypeptidase-like regulatory domain-containing protein [Cyclobacteriaceae bacterium]